MKSGNPQIIVAQLGARMHYAVPALLERAGMLSHFYTDAYVGPGSPWQALAIAANFIPAAWRPDPFKRLLCRRVEDLPSEKITAFNLFGLSYALAQKRARQAGDLSLWDKVHLEYGRKFCDLVMHNWSEDVAGIYTFEGAALSLLNHAGTRGITSILEKYIAPMLLEYELVLEEHQLWPEWEAPYPSMKLFQERFALEQAEWLAADAILCASDFVALSLTSLGVPRKKLHIVPYGVEPASFAVQHEPMKGQRPLRILFIGMVTLRKGPQYLYEALEILNSRKFAVRIVGSIAIREFHLSRLRVRAELTGSVPRLEVRRHYEWADVFVLPSICEGSATVVYEALAAGLPVITTPNAGSVVRDGVEGFIVPIRDSEAIAAKLDHLASDSALLAWMSANAQARAREFSLEMYGERLISAINRILADNTK